MSKRLPTDVRNRTHTSVPDLLEHMRDAGLSELELPQPKPVRSTRRLTPLPTVEDIRISTLREVRQRYFNAYSSAEFSTWLRLEIERAT